MNSATYIERKIFVRIDWLSKNSHQIPLALWMLESPPNGVLPLMMNDVIGV